MEFPEPEPAHDGVVVDIQLCGICGTDIHAYHSGREYNPAICGHEWTGVLSAVGDQVGRLSEGDRVVVAVHRRAVYAMPVERVTRSGAKRASSSLSDGIAPRRRTAGSRPDSR